MEKCCFCKTDNQMFTGALFENFSKNVFHTLVMAYKMCTMYRDKMYRDSNKYILDRLINCKLSLSHC